MTDNAPPLGIIPNGIKCKKRIELLSLFLAPRNVAEALRRNSESKPSKKQPELPLKKGFEASRKKTWRRKRQNSSVALAGFQSCFVSNHFGTPGSSLESAFHSL